LEASKQKKSKGASNKQSGARAAIHFQVKKRPDPMGRKQRGQERAHSNLGGVC